MKQERRQKLHESEAEQHPCAKMPKLGHQSHHQHYDPASASALALFVPQPKISSRTGNYFSLGQWQELELQALIYRYMLAGSAVPPELLLPIKQSLLLSHPSFHFQPALLHWRRDPEPENRREEVVGGHKYCERHMHRGRNRSRKPVEIPTPAAPQGSRRRH